MARWRTVTAGITGLVLGAGLAIGGATSASAAPVGHWGTFTLAGESRAYTGTVTLPGFPATTFTSDSRQSTVVSGQSTWQGTGTGPGAVYDSSRGSTYLNQRPLADSPNQASASTTTYTFAGATPPSGWSFVLGDVDADQATISATLPGGGPATAAQLGFQGAYNSCSVSSPGGWSCPADPDGTRGQDVPTWDAATRTLVGNAGAVDTAGATAWFSPTVSLATLTITYQQRSGFPVYQTWFADRTASISGTATLDGVPLPGSTVTATAPGGATYTTTTGADGGYAFPGLALAEGYRVEVAAPTGAIGGDPRTGIALTDDLTGQDFAFTSPPGTTAVIGTVTGNGEPVPNVPVTITDGDTVLLDTVTNSQGAYVVSDLPPETELSLTVDGTSTTITTGAEGTVLQPSTTVDAAVGTVSGTVAVDEQPVGAGVPVELVDGDGTVVATTTTDATGAWSFTALFGSYTVRTATPAGTSAVNGSQAVSVSSTPVSGVLLSFRTEQAQPEVVEQTGRVTDPSGAAVSGATVVATPTEPDSGAPVTTTSAADGTFTLVGLAPTTEYSATADGGAAVTFRSVDVGSPAAPAIVLVVPAATGPTTPPTQTPVPSGTPTAAVPVVDPGATGAGGSLAYTGADITPGLIAAGVLVLLGAGLLTSRSVRNRRRTDPQD